RDTGLAMKINGSKQSAAIKISHHAKSRQKNFPFRFIDEISCIDFIDMPGTDLRARSSRNLVFDFYLAGIKEHHRIHGIGTHSLSIHDQVDLRATPLLKGRRRGREVQRSRLSFLYERKSCQ